MKIVISTTPIRPTSTDYPPFGSLAVMQALRAAGYDPFFYDIDGLRPSFEEVERFFAERQPDVLGISAVVSTAYSYTKRLTRMIRRVSPKTRIVLGGNLAASAEILHRLAGIDYCVSGEGETVIVNLMAYLRDCVVRGVVGEDYEALRQVKGITFVDNRGEMVFTGYELKIGVDAIHDPDYGILEKFSDINLYINDPFGRPDFVQDPRSHEAKRRGKKMATIVTAKGCVARCTFCHRWDKGYRAYSVNRIERVARRLIDHYNVGYFQLGDENFGSDKRQVTEFIDIIKPFDVLYTIQGVRCRTVDPLLLKKLKDSGCVAAYYGMETGSQRILEVMEKNTTREHNLNAARWTKDAGLYTIYQLVLAMPGESPETIQETSETFMAATEVLDEPPVRKLSINYIQALPGTPVYEYARHRGFLGKSMPGEEEYLELISDVDAADDTKFINFTGWDYLTVQSWRLRIILACTANWRKKKGIPPPSLREMYYRLVLRWANAKRYDEIHRKMAAEQGLDYDKGGYFNLQQGIYYDIIACYLYPFRTPLLWSGLLVREFRRLGIRKFSARLAETFSRRLRGVSHDAFNDYRSLRKVVDGIAPPPATSNETAMVPLRAGR